jgi:hypothetical protein
VVVSRFLRQPLKPGVIEKLSFDTTSAACGSLNGFREVVVRQKLKLHDAKACGVLNNFREVVVRQN